MGLTENYMWHHKHTGLDVDKTASLIKRRNKAGHVEVGEKKFLIQTQKQAPRGQKFYG